MSIYVGFNDPYRQSLRNGLAAWWTLDEANGSRIDSYSGITLADYNTVLSTSGIRNSGAQFQSFNAEYLALEDTGTLRITGAFSAGFWWRQDSNLSDSVGRGLMSRWRLDDGNRAWLVSQYNDKIFYIITATGTSTYSNYQIISNSISLDEWHFVVAVFEPNQLMRLYIDGKFEGDSVENPPSVYDSSCRFHIGTQDNNVKAPYAPDGDIDEAFLYNRALLSGEVQVLYNGGEGLTYSTLPK